jgi:ribosomal protein S18 acetylase RimI-like enzyme
MYDRLTGDRGRSLALLRRAFDVPGTSASAEVVAVAEAEGRVAGALVAFAVDESLGRARSFMRLTLRATPPWRWPGALWLYWAGARAAPSPPLASLYIDALAVDPASRRQGVAKALLRHAEELASERGIRRVSLDTALDNRAARALYRASGYDEVAYRPAGRGLPGFVALVKPLS